MEQIRIRLTSVGQELARRIAHRGPQEILAFMDQHMLQILRELARPEGTHGRETGQRATEAGPDRLPCRHCGLPARLEECWDLNACGRSILLMIQGQHCGIGPESPYGSTAITYDPTSALR